MEAYSLKHPDLTIRKLKSVKFAHRWQVELVELIMALRLREFPSKGLEYIEVPIQVVLDCYHDVMKTVNENRYLETLHHLGREHYFDRRKFIRDLADKDRLF